MKLVDIHRAVSAPISRADPMPISRAESMPISRAAPAPTSGGECITPEIVAPRGDDGRCVALEARILSHNKVNQDCDLFPNSETEPTRVRRMRGEVPQSYDPSEAMMSPRVQESEIALTGISAPGLDEKKSWANDLINGAQLVSVRILRNKTQRYVTLNRKDQGLWPCVARRITKDLETGEVRADEDVTQMTTEKLHRTFDKPRKERVEFYAHLNGDDADRPEEEEECAPTNLLDPVDEQRSLIETLLSLGVDQSAAAKKVSELYSPPRVTLEAQRRPALGISGMRAFDLSTAHPDGGNWISNLKTSRNGYPHLRG